MRYFLIILLALVAILAVSSVRAHADNSTIVVVQPDSDSGTMCVVLPSGSVYCP